MDTIILIGMRGCGKSHFGSLLGQILGMPRIDIDECVEAMVGKTISRIIETEGWDAFRDYEHAAIRKACQQKNVIIATGGGAITFERNKTLLQASGKIVFLFSSLQELLGRLKNDTSRPSLTAENTLKDEIVAVWNERKDIYFSSADIVFWSKDIISSDHKEAMLINAKILATRLKSEYLSSHI